MRKIVNRTLYDTDNATLIWKGNIESLYISNNKKEYFTRAKFVWDDIITPLTKDEAIEWAINILPVEEFFKHFDDVYIEEA